MSGEITGEPAPRPTPLRDALAPDDLRSRLAAAERYVRAWEAVEAGVNGWDLHHAQVDELRAAADAWHAQGPPDPAPDGPTDEERPAAAGVSHEKADRIVGYIHHFTHQAHPPAFRDAIALTPLTDEERAAVTYTLHNFANQRELAADEAREHDGIKEAEVIERYIALLRAAAAKLGRAERGADDERCPHGYRLPHLCPVCGHGEPEPPAPDAGIDRAAVVDTVIVYGHACQQAAWWTAKGDHSGAFEERQAAAAAFAQVCRLLGLPPEERTDDGPNR